MTSARITGLYRLFRFELPLTAGVCILLGEVLALGGLPSPRQAIYGFLSFSLSRQRRRSSTATSTLRQIGSMPRLARFRRDWSQKT